jgi:succinate dehydrogenase / fumarate reductase cytochrome b subunit
VPKTAAGTRQSPGPQAPGPLAASGKRPQGTLYRGREGMWSWVLHRVTGVAIYFFLLVHVLDTALIRLSPEAYNAVIGTYKNPIMGLGETALVAAIVFHAFNGIRIILIDFWSKGPRYQKVMFYIVIVLWVVAMLGFAPRHLINVFSEMG